MSLLSLQNLHISASDTPIVRGLDLTVNPGEIHAIMGPNGSGKSTLVNALAGHPAYEVTSGDLAFRGVDLGELEPHERAQQGLFLAFQYPKEIAGVKLRDFLFAAKNAVMQARDPEAKRLSPFQFQKELASLMERLHIDPAFAERAVNQGFSGGEKKKAEILQMHVLKPQLALLDETDSGLDVDALKVVAEGVNAMRNLESRISNFGESGDQDSKFKIQNSFSAIIVTHYARILEYIQPDFVHVMVNGKIRESGGAELAHTLEKEGYAKYGVREQGQRLSLDVVNSN